MSGKLSRKRGLLFVVSGPSGCGKTTLGNGLLRVLPGLVRSVSVTTRPRRKGERQGREYFFVDEEQFNRLLKKDKFLEWAKVFGCFYGTLRETVFKNIKQGRDVILLIDVQGAMQIKKKFPQAVFVFISPPSLGVLRERLIKRGLDSLCEIRKRFSRASREMVYNKVYNYEIINEKIKTSCEILKSIILAERCRVK